jgi:hypothetical protein
MIQRLIIIVLLFATGLSPVSALDFYLDPDTLQGSTGGHVTLSGQITASGLMRSFTVYLAYDTNVIALVPPPVAGPVIAGHAGLQFNYFDHAPIHTDLLEVTGTIFGNALWQGPGELFHLQFELRDCADAPITAPFAPFFLDGNNNVVPTTFAPAIVGVCPRVPAAPTHLVINASAASNITLHWNAVFLDTLNRPLFNAPSYRVQAQQILPIVLPEIIVTVTADTFTVVPAIPADQSWNFRVSAFTP